MERNKDSEVAPLPDQERLQILSYREEILKKIKQNQVTIIAAETGSGKTTQVPQFLLDEAAKQNKNCKILVSQPRKIAAITVAKRVAYERNVELGEEVCYQVGLDVQKSDDFQGNRVTYCTSGVILQKVVYSRNLDSFTHVILDEIHEREINMDLLVTIVRELLNNDSEIRVVLMSATLDIDLFAKYFTSHINMVLIPPGIIKLTTNRRFKIEEKYLDELKYRAQINFEPGISSNIYQVAKQVIKDELRNGRKVFLVFLPGIAQIESMHTLLSEDDDLSKNTITCVLHSSLSMADQQIVFTPTSKPKIVLATNIAESSVTIRDVSCVIDFCLTKILTSKENSTMSSLELRWAGKDSLNQRRGRTGRTCDGIVYRLIDRKFFEKHLDEYSTPEMERVPLEQVVLKVKLLDFEPPENLLAKAMNPPNADAISTAVLVLKEVGGLQRLDDNREYLHNDGRLTYVGRIMATLPLDVRVTKLVVLGYVFSVLDDAIVMAAGLTIKSIFRTSFRDKLSDFSAKLAWADGSGCDLTAILNAYTSWRHLKMTGAFDNKDSERKWCESHRLEMKSLYEMRALIKEIKTRLQEMELEALPDIFGVTWSKQEKTLILKIVIAGTFIPNFFIFGESTEEREQEIYKETSGWDPYKSLILRKFNNKYTGEVYEETVKDKLIQAGIAGSRQEMKVFFPEASSKVIVEFTGSKKIGKIPVEVFKGVKSRQLQNKFVIEVMSPEETENYAKSFGIGLEERGNFLRFRNSVTMKYPDFCIIPLTAEKQLPGKITAIENCGKFYIFPKYEFNEEMMEKIQESSKFLATEVVTSPKPHQNVIVATGSEFFRAKITENLEIFLVDSGKTVTGSKVFKAPEELFDVTERCFEARLVGIEPSAMTSGDFEAMTKRFAELVTGNDVIVEVYSVVNRVSAVTIFVDDICVNDVLVNEGFAQEVEENFPSKQNHELRKEIQANEARQFDAATEFADYANELLTPHVPKPPADRCTQKMFLFGPSSPMETSVSHCFQDINISSVSVDPNSVNSVVLCDNPGNIYGHLMIAADITKGAHGMTIRETSMMPNIPGLPMLLAMIFAPDAHFRRDETQTKYENLLFGLGDFNGRSAMFKQHDCVIPVHFKVDDEDFTDVNFLRFQMSYLLATDRIQLAPVLSAEEKSEIMKDIQKRIRKILSKTREPLAMVYGQKDCDWSPCGDFDVKEWKDQFFGFFYHLIKQPLLKTEPTGVKELIKDLRRLELEVSGQSKGNGGAIKSYTCPICNRDFDGIFQLQIHFSSKIHQTQLKILNVA